MTFNQAHGMLNTEKGIVHPKSQFFFWGDTFFGSFMNQVIKHANGVSKYGTPWLSGSVSDLQARHRRFDRLLG